MYIRVYTTVVYTLVHVLAGISLADDVKARYLTAVQTAMPPQQLPRLYCTRTSQPQRSYA